MPMCTLIKYVPWHQRSEEYFEKKFKTHQQKYDFMLKQVSIYNDD